HGRVCAQSRSSSSGFFLPIVLLLARPPTENRPAEQTVSVNSVLPDVPMRLGARGVRSPVAALCGHRAAFRYAAESAHLLATQNLPSLVRRGDARDDARRRRRRLAPRRRHVRRDLRRDHLARPFWSAKIAPTISALRALDLNDSP